MALNMYFSCFLGKIHNGENDRNVNNVSSSNNDSGASADPMLPCEFCDGLVPMRKLLEHQVRVL